MFAKRALFLKSAIVAIGLLFLVSYAAPAKNKPKAAVPEQQIQYVLEEQVAAWNKGDLEAFMQGYWHSEKLSFYSTSKGAGWNATLERYRQRYTGEGKEMGKLDFSELEIELLGPKSAFVRGHWHLKMTKSGDVGGLFTLVFKKFPDGWKIIHDHTSTS